MIFFCQVQPEPSMTPVIVKSTKAKNKSSSNSATPARSAKAQEAAKAREEVRRKMLEERRKLAKAKKNEDDWGKFNCNKNFKNLF